MRSQLLFQSIALAVSAVPALAQWSADPAVNDALAVRPSDQNLAKVSAAPDGGFWVSWLDGIGTGWDVRAQKLDVLGRAAFTGGGALVADRGFSSTQDYGLDVSPGGDALLAYRTDLGGGVEVGASRITAQGTLRWAVQLTNGAGFVASPKVAATADGDAVVAWTQDTEVRLVRLDAAGAPRWVGGVTLTPPVGSYVLADLRADGDEVVASIVHQTGGFTAPRHLVAQRFDAAGAPMWGATPLAVFDGGSLQIGNFPPLSLDDAGGAVFAWYSSSPSLQCFVQRVDAGGVERWAHGGVPVATAPGAVRVNPEARFDPATGDVVAVWKEQNIPQSMSGVSLQRLDAAGGRRSGDAGLALVAVGAGGADFPRVVALDGAGAALVAWEEAPAFGADQVFAARIDAGGAVVTPRFDVASTPSGKMRFASDVSSSGTALLAWSDARGDGGDIYGMAFAPDGALGGRAAIGAPTCAGVANSTGAGALLAALGSATVQVNDVTLWATSLPPGAFGFFLTSPAGASTPQPGGSQGTLCLGGAIGRYVGPGQVQASGQAGAFSLALDLAQHPTPSGFVAVTGGQSWHFQAWYRDANPGPTSNFTGALRIDFP